jgi:murein DD-endopeptidase MepM/ murein hydrolase activator NlpD
VNGRAETAEGFAVDLLQLRKDGRVYSGPVNQLSSYAYYGANVYSAASGKVVEVVRDMPDEVPGSTPTHITVVTAAGNHVIVKMADKRYAMYAHLVPNSVTVQVGDWVETGQVLGKLGNSGSTSAPHLHFQVMDAPSSSDAHGLPFVFDQMGRRFVNSGSLNDEGAQTIGGEPLTLVLAPNPGQLQDVMPLTFDLLDF